MAKKINAAPSLELQYQELFRYATPPLPVSEDYSLEQPTPLKVVQSVVTYGLEERPIMGDVGALERAELEMMCSKKFGHS